MQAKIKTFAGPHTTVNIQQRRSQSVMSTTTTTIIITTTTSIRRTHPSFSNGRPCAVDKSGAYLCGAHVVCGRVIVGIHVFVYVNVGVGTQGQTAKQAQLATNVCEFIQFIQFPVCSLCTKHQKLTRLEALRGPQNDGDNERHTRRWTLPCLESTCRCWVLRQCLETPAAA